jgi:hypothetical protein
MYSHGTSNVVVPAHSSQDSLTSSPSPGRVPLISLYARSGKVALAPEQYFLKVNIQMFMLKYTTTGGNN